MATTAAVRARARAAIRRGISGPLAVEGPSGAGKTRVLRAIAAEFGPTSWSSAIDFAHEAVAAMRGDRYRAFTKALAADPRPLVIEHLEDLEGKPRTREELKRALLLRAERGGATILTLTAGRGRSEILDWLSPWAEIVSLAPPPPKSRARPSGALIPRSLGREPESRSKKPPHRSP